MLEDSEWLTSIDSMNGSIHKRKEKKEKDRRDGRLPWRYSYQCNCPHLEDHSLSIIHANCPTRHSHCHVLT